MQRGFKRATVVALIAFIFSARGAVAQTVTLPPAFARKQPRRPDGQRPNWVSRSDCLARDVLTFDAVSLSDYQDLTLQVWAGKRGTDCSLAKNQGEGGCWLLYSEPASNAETRVDIPAIDLVAGGRSNGSAAKVVHGTYPGTCLGAPERERVALTLHFFLVDARGTVEGDEASWTDIGYDVAPPSSPTHVTGSAGDTRLYMDWTQSPELDVRAYRFYCDPTRGAAVAGATSHSTAPPLGPLSDSEAVEAGATEADAAPPDKTAKDAGRSSTCSDTTALAKGADPDYPDSLAAYACGSTSSADASGMIEHLKNYTDYVVAVAAVDEVGNAGKLSDLVCATPVEVTDFYELYRQAGGTAGGGICSLSRRNAGTPAAATVFGAIAVAGALRRSSAGRIRWRGRAARALE